jgi:uncharacterized protein (TIRG00374 family)
MRRADPAWLALGGLVYASHGFIRAWRWRYILPEAAFRALFSATQIGSLGQLAIPLRSGPIIRALVLARLTGIPLARALASALVDRIAESCMIPLIFLLLIFLIPGDQVFTVPAAAFGLGAPLVFTGQVFRAGLALFLLLLGGLVGVLVLLHLFRDQAARIADRVAGAASPRWGRRLAAGVRQFSEAVNIFRATDRLVSFVALDFVGMAAFLGSAHCMLMAFSVPMPWYGSALVIIATGLSIFIPGAPGLVGQLHALFIIAVFLIAPDFPVDHAKAVAIVMHAMYFSIVVAMGAACLALEHMNLWELERASQGAMDQEETKP